MKLVKFIRQSIKKADFFSTNELLRYKGESDYKTVFGGSISLLIIILLVTMFYYRLVSCIQKDSISDTEQTIINEIPSLSTIDTFPKGNFMLAITIGRFSRTKQSKFFDISMNYLESVWDYDLNKWNQTTTKVPLQKCTRQHWKLLSRMEKQYDAWNLGEMLCMPMNSSYDIQGDQFSDISKKLTIKVKPCNNESQPDQICASESQIGNLFTSYQSLNARIYMINQNINPSTKNYIQYTFNYKNFLTFNRQQASTGTIYVQDYEIETDESLIPVPIVKTDSGLRYSTEMIPRKLRKINDSNIYCEFNIMKSETSKKYLRTFQKIDELLAFFGGLFGILSMFLVIVSSYNNLAYEISLGSCLFKPQDQTQMRTFRNYNFYSYFWQILYHLLDLIGKSPEWNQTLEYNKCQKQMEKQLDIQYILNRIMYLETAISIVLQDHHARALHLKEKITLNQAKSKRKNFKTRQNMIKMKKELEKRKTNKQKSQKSNKKLQQSSSIKIIDTLLEIPENYNGSEKSNQFLSEIVNTQILQNMSNAQTKSSKAVQVQILEKSRQSVEFSFQSESESSSNSEGENDVFVELKQLKDEFEEGNKISKKIWSISNKAILSILPQLSSSQTRIVAAIDFSSSKITKSLFIPKTKTNDFQNMTKVQEKQSQPNHSKQQKHLSN